MLPYEKENIQKIDRDFKPQFQVCEELLKLVYGSVLPELHEAVVECPLITRGVAVGILAREIRRYRSVVAMCQMGYVESAEILNRSLFESLLAERFIFRGDKPLEKCSDGLAKRRGNLPEIPANFSQRDFRALLYQQAEYINLQAVNTKAVGVGGQLAITGKRNQEGMKSIIEEIRQVVGEEWYNVLTKHPRTFSGLTVRELAENCEHEGMYATVYGLFSNTVHAGDPVRHIHINDERKLFSAVIAGFRPQDLLHSLQISSAILAQASEDLAIAFQLPAREKIDAMVAKIESIDP